MKDINELIKIKNPNLFELLEKKPLAQNTKKQKVTSSK